MAITVSVVVFLLTQLLMLPIAVSETVSLPTEPEWSAYRITNQDLRDARKAKRPLMEHLFGERAEAVSRFNRLDPRLVWPGRRLKVPRLPEGQVEYQPLPARYPPVAKDSKAAVIVLEMQFIGLYENGQLQASYPISSGKRGHRTPVGSFQVTRKHRWHKSSVYPEPDGGWPMSYGVRFHGTAFWIHEGQLPGHPASHGCVRLMPGDAAAFYRWAEIGIPIVIVRSLP